MRDEQNDYWKFEKISKMKRRRRRRENKKALNISLKLQSLKMLVVKNIAFGVFFGH